MNWTLILNLVFINCSVKSDQQLKNEIKAQIVHLHSLRVLSQIILLQSFLIESISTFKPPLLLLNEKETKALGEYYKNLMQALDELPTIVNNEALIEAQKKRIIESRNKLVNDPEIKTEKLELVFADLVSSSKYWLMKCKGETSKFERVTETFGKILKAFLIDKKIPKENFVGDVEKKVEAAKLRFFEAVSEMHKAIVYKHPDDKLKTEEVS